MNSVWSATLSRPPWLHGLHLNSLQLANTSPRSMPNSSIAWVAYLEHDGSYLHRGGRPGEIQLLQTLIGAVTKRRTNVGRQTWSSASDLLQDPVSSVISSLILAPRSCRQTQAARSKGSISLSIRRIQPIQQCRLEQQRQHHFREQHGLPERQRLHAEAA